MTPAEQSRYHRRDVLAAGLALGGPLTDFSSSVPSVLTPSPEVRWQFRAEGLVLPEALQWAINPMNGTLFAGGDGTVYALRTADGSTRWRRPFEGDRAVPIPHGGTVYVVTGETVHALSGFDGSRKWQFRADGDVVLPVRHGDYFVLRDESKLYALGLARGEHLWTFDRPVVGAPVVGDGTVYAVTSDAAHALRGDDGSEEWRFEADFGTVGDVVGSGFRRVYVWDGGTVRALDRSEGRPEWTLETDLASGEFRGLLSHDGGHVWGERTLYAVTEEGDVRWTFEAESPGRFILRVEDDTVFVGTEDALYALNETDGTEQWRFSRQAGSQWTEPRFVDEILYTVDEETLIALDLATGDVRWRFEPDDGRVVHAHSFFRETAYAATDSGTVYALSKDAVSPVASVTDDLSNPASLLTGGAVGGALVGGTLVGGALLAAATYWRRSADEPAGSDGLELRSQIGTHDGVEVHEAFLDGSPVLVRRLAPDATISREECIRSIRTWRDFDVEGVAPVRNWGPDPRPWVALDRPRATLADERTELGVDERLRVLLRICNAVHETHRAGTVHGNLRPQSVVFLGDPAPETAHVTDWALVPQSGSSPFAAPEQESGAESTERTDVYRLGAVAYWLVTGDAPDDGCRPGGVIDSVVDPNSVGEPDSVGDVLETALATDPADRYASVLAFQDALQWSALVH